MLRILTSVLACCTALLVACSGSASSPTPAAAPPTTAPAPASPAALSASPSPAALSASPSAAASAAVLVPSPSALASPSAVATATALPRPTVPSPTPAAQLSPTPAAPHTVWIANTDGGGVFLRNSPHEGDRANAEAIAENTPLTVTGELVEGDGQQWWPVTTSDGQQGYVPQPYTTEKDPQAPPAPLVPDQAK